MNEKDLEILSLLQEECAEVIHIVSKIRRFGLDSYNPYDPKQIPNKTLMEDEIGDTLLIARILEERGLVDPVKVQERIDWKRTKLVERGIIDD